MYRFSIKFLFLTLFISGIYSFSAHGGDCPPNPEGFPPGGIPAPDIPGHVILPFGSYPGQEYQLFAILDTGLYFKRYLSKGQVQQSIIGGVATGAIDRGCEPCFNTDSDGDSWSDCAEIQHGTDPKNGGNSPDTENSGLFGAEYKIFVFEQELQKVEGRRVKGERVLYRMGQPYFSLYDSFNKPIDGGQSSDVSPFEHEYEKHLRKGLIRGRFSLIFWFLRKNFNSLSRAFTKILILLSVVVFLRYGGVSYISEAFMSGISGKKEAAEKSSAPSLPEVPESVPKNASEQEKSRLEQIRKTYEEELRKSLVEREKLSVELEKAMKEIGDLSSVSLMTPGAIVFKRGHEYAIGQEILSGDYKGRTLLGINYRRREAILDDGSVLHLSGD